MSNVLEVRGSDIYELGCFTLVTLKKGRSFAAYAGELVRGKRKIEARLRKQEAIKIIWINADTAIDGAVGGNETAFINHSCAPNAYMRGAPPSKVLFFALRDIDLGEEITINYRDPQHPPPHACPCGAANCRSIKAEARA
jgi:SET domain-containing protein